MITSNEALCGHNEDTKCVIAVIGVGLPIGEAVLSEVVDYYQGAIDFEIDPADGDIPDIMPPLFNQKMVETRQTRAYNEHKLKRGKGHNRLKRRK